MGSTMFLLPGVLITLSLGINACHTGEQTCSWRRWKVRQTPFSNWQNVRTSSVTTLRIHSSAGSMDRFKFWVCFYGPGPNFISIRDRHFRYMEYKPGFQDNVLEVSAEQTQTISKCSDRRLLNVRRSNIDWLDLKNGRNRAKLTFRGGSLRFNPGAPAYLESWFPRWL